MLNEKYVEIGSRIKFLRKELGLTQLAFALKVGVAGKNNVANWEKGRSTPGHEQLFKICEMTNRTTDWILTGKTDDQFELIWQRIKDAGIETADDFNAVFPEGKYMMDVTEYFEIIKNKKK